MRHVISNLVDKAIKYTPPNGKVELAIRTLPDLVRLSVTDTGVGIAPEHVPHVFERFYKADTARAAESTGSGLGLSITKAIVERHGGTIGVTSQPGHTTFTIVLPQSR